MKYRRIDYEDAREIEWLSRERGLSPAAIARQVDCATWQVAKVLELGSAAWWKPPRPAADGRFCGHA